MAVGISIKLPLDKGFSLNKTNAAKITQNLKMVLLTSPGERVALPNFGVGIRRFLFEQLAPETLTKIRLRIEQQAKTYVPSAKIEDVLFDSYLNNSSLVGSDENSLKISVIYRVPTINRSMVLNLAATPDNIVTLD
jgi:phage baseplate assembly protein W